jgi:hypothetical protein
MQTKNSNNFLLAVFTCVLSVQTCRGADATGLMPGVYTEGADGKFIAVTNNNISTLWPGVWRENTNGLRVQLQSETESGQPLLHIGVGSVLFNSLGGFVGAPSGCGKYELRDTNGVIAPYAKETSSEGTFPPRISIKDLPRWANGGLKNHIAFFTNGGPFTLADIKLDQLYAIPTEGNYTLTVCPVIYKFETNKEYLDRVDLPCVTIKVHLKPSNE